MERSLEYTTSGKHDQGGESELHSNGEEKENNQR